jgi:flavin reductase (DIM6/NTAB) family NADH-FMN oxidoreductase RutF
MNPESAFDTLVADLDYPMFIVTAAAGGERAGCLVGFVTQASIEPSRMLVMLSKANRTYRVAADADELVVHFPNVDNESLAALFGQETDDEVDKFAFCSWDESPAKTPILRGTNGWIAGRILHRFDGGDHVGHLLDITDARAEARLAHLTFQAVRDMEPGHRA